MSWIAEAQIHDLKRPLFRPIQNRHQQQARKDLISETFRVLDLGFLSVVSQASLFRQPQLFNAIHVKVIVHQAMAQHDSWSEDRVF